MAAVTNPIRPFDEHNAGAIRRVENAQRAKALGLLLTGRPTASGTAVDQFLQYARDQNLDTTELWAYYDGESPLVAVLVVPSPGRTAMVFLSPLQDRGLIDAASRLITTAMPQLDSKRIRIVQALLEPGQAIESQALIGGGFTMLAHLVYMQRSAGSRGRELALDGDQSLFNWKESHRSRFETAILATYEQTLDCPGLLGVRKIDEIIAGHMSTGQFDPALWFAIYAGEQPVAAMILCDLPQRDSLEMVYLGVTRPYRGKGLAQRLVEHSFFLARQRRRKHLLLAVDEHNTPALKLYRRNGYEAQTRKTALIHPVGLATD